MTLSAYRQHKIYIAAMMGFSLGLEDPEELSCYRKVKQAMEKDRKNRNIGVTRVA